MIEARTAKSIARNPSAGIRCSVSPAAAVVLGLAVALGSAGTTVAAEAAAASAPATAGTVVGRVQNQLTGNFLNNARVSVIGTNIEVFSNQFGEYTINDAPSGDIKIKVFFTGLEQQTVDVFVPEGQVVLQDFSLKTIGQEEDVIALDEFVVASNRETNAAAIAQQEQRFSANIKSVVDSGAFGDVTEGNVGEFVKYLPGVSVDYVAADVRTMSVRGFSDNFTTIAVDGGRMASASSGNAQRSFEFEQVSLNNISRAEIVKVPRPEDPADSLGGAVNLISKSAFERDRAQLKYKAYLSINSEDTNILQKTPGPQDQNSHKALPGFDFDYTLPLSKKFGIVVTGLSSNQFNEQHRAQPRWNFAQAGATVANPYLDQYQLQDGPKNTWRQSASVRADWKVAPNHLLSATLSWGHYQSAFGNRNVTWNIGTTSVPSTTTGVALTWDPTATNGATGRGSVNMGTSFRDKLGNVLSGNLKYTFTGRDWNVEAGVNKSRSKSWYRDTANGHFDQISLTMLNVSRVQFGGYNNLYPQSITVLNAAGTALDSHLLSNYRLDTVNTRPVDGTDEFLTIYGSVKRELNLSFPASIKIGAEQRKQQRDMRRRQESWRYVGVDKVAASADDVATFSLDNAYATENPYWGQTPIQWASPFVIKSLFDTNPELFDQGITNLNAATQFRLRNSQYLEEKVTSAYVQADARFLSNRLRVVTGVRYEKTEDSGLGALTPAWDSTTPKDRYYIFTWMQNNWKERGKSVEGSYDGFYPSLHLSFNITDDLVARAAYARTYGRPDFGTIVPSVRVNDSIAAEDDDVGAINPRTIIANNPALKPWTADNIDLGLAYYIPKGGEISVGAFQKDLTDFWVTGTRPVTQADLDALQLPDEYLTQGFQITTTDNGGDAKIKGFEFNYQQPLKFLPWYFKNLNFSANGTRLFLSGPKGADFQRFISETANVALTYSKSPVTLMMKLNYRGRQRLTAQTGGNFGAANGFYQYYSPRLNLDINAEYMLSKKFSLFLNARNVTNVSQDLVVENGLNPSYSNSNRIEEYGVQWAVGVKGQF